MRQRIHMWMGSPSDGWTRFARLMAVGVIAAVAFTGVATPAVAQAAMAQAAVAVPMKAQTPKAAIIKPMVAGQPGVPSPGTVVFEETFSNQNAASAPISIVNYTGTGSRTYYALPATGGIPGWVPSTGTASACNGWILQYATRNSPNSTADPRCANSAAANSAFLNLGTMVQALGIAQGQGTNNTNQALSAYSNAASGAQRAGVQFRTNQNTIPVVPGRYYSASAWFAGQNCGLGVDPRQSFDLLRADGSVLQTIGSNINPCTAAGNQEINQIRISRIWADSIRIPAGTTQVGLSMSNSTATGAGNDQAFDLPSLVDVTPQLDKSFSPSTIRDGQNSTLTLTITNTSELVAKTDFGFTDNFPSTLRTVGPATTTCGNGVATTTTNSVTLTGGDLANGVVSCTVTVQVTAPIGTHTNGPTNIDPINGLLPPLEATLTVLPNLNVSKTFVGSTINPTTGVSTANYTVAVRNVGPTATTYGALTDTPAFGAGLTRTGATWTVSGTGAPPGGSATGAGPYTLTGANTPIAGSATHTFALAVNYTGQTTSVVCGGPGTALYNSAALPSGQEAGVTTDNAACGVPLLSDPRITLVKTVAPTAGLTPGATATYTLVARNTGNVTLTGVSIAETAFSGVGTLGALNCPAGPSVTLTPNSAYTCTATYIVQPGDLLAGSVTNVARTTGTPPIGAAVTATDDAVFTTVPPSPAIQLVKEADVTTGLEVGDTVTYTFTATNTGNLPLTSVAIEETDFSGAAPMSALVCSPTAPAALAAGASIECTAEYVIQQADVDAGTITNVATATGTPLGGGTPVSATAEETVTTVVGVGDIDIEKEADVVSGVGAGDTITYTFTVRNTGTVTLNNIVLAEEAFSGVGDMTAFACDQGIPATLVPNGSFECTATYVAQQGDVDAQTLTNVASVSAATPTGAAVTAEDDAVVALETADPDITLVKTPSVASGVVVGDTVTYTLTAQNTGNVTLTGVAMAETAFSGAGDLSDLVCAQPVVLAPQQTLTCTVTYVVRQGDINAGSFTNAASVSGQPPTGPAETATDDAVVTTATANPSITLDKTATPASAVVLGQTISYTFTAQNTGNVTLSDVLISETDFTGAGDLSGLVCAQPTTLDPGGVLTCTATYVVEQGDIDSGEIFNAASVSGTPPTGPAVTAVDDVSVTPVQPVPAIDIEKTADVVADAAVGDTITYTLVARNLGNATLTNVSISEADFDGAGNLSAVACAQPVTLAPLASLTCTVTYEVQQGDVDAGVFTNIAAVQGTPPTGPALTDTDDAVVRTIAAAPALTLTKTADITSDLAVGDTVTYAFVATNTGNVTLDDVTIADTEFSGAGDLTALACDPAAPAVLIPGASIDCTASYVIEQADVDAGTVTNLATATGTDPAGSPVEAEDDEAVTTVAAAPALEIVKSANETENLEVGDTVTYSFVATNTGNVTLSAVSIADTNFTGAGDLAALACDPTAPATLAPGEDLECSATYVVQQGDVDAGSIDNLATATGTPPAGTPITVEDDETVTTVAAAPALELVKTADITTGLDVGDTVTYSFVATNTGNVTLTAASIAETDFSGAGTMSALSCDPSVPATLAPGDTIECSATYDIEQGDIDAGVVTNVATATATDPSGATVAAEDDAAVTTIAADPSIELTKSANPATGVIVGDTVAYTFVATNTGNVTLTDVAIADTDFAAAGDLTALVCDPATPAVVAPDASITCTATYVIQQGDLDAGEVYNLATATGTPPNGADPVTDQDDVSVIPALPSPAISLVKTADVVSGLGVGDVVNYTFVATNIGNVTLSDVSIEDTDFSGAGALSPLICTPAAPAELTPGATQTCTASYTVEQADVDAGSLNNIATTTGTPPTGPDVTATDEESISTEVAAPGITVVKTADVTTDVAVGDTVTYSVIATNTGNVTLTDVSVADTQFGGAGDLSPLACDPTAPATLAPGAEIECAATYVVEQGDVDAGSFVNIATATGTPPGEGAPPVSDDDDETVTTVVADPQIEVVKTADITTDLAVGDTVTYSLVATNTGNVTLTSVSIADTDFSGAGDLSAIVCDPAAPAILAPGDSIDCTASYVVEQADVDAGSITNVATATATPPGDGVPPISDDDEETVTTVEADPGIELEKTADQTVGLGVGDTVTYAFVATNTGNVTLTNVTIADTDFSGIGDLSALVCDPAAPADLAPGAFIDCSATYVIQQGDVDAGTVTNTATATGTDPDGDPVTGDDDETVATEVADPAIELLKTASPAIGVSVGDTVSYTLVATNTGNVTLSDVSIEDTEFVAAGDLSALTCVPGAPVMLAPGGSIECAATYVVEQGDVDAGEIYNRATATGTPPNGAEPVTDEDDASVVPVQPNPAIALVKSADITTGLAVGDTVTYSFVATNTGNVSLADVTIDETDFSGTGTLSPLACDPAIPAELAPGQTVDCSATYVVEQADVDAGSVTNLATVTGNPPTGDPVVAEDGETVTTETADPTIELVKTADVTSDLAVGDTVTYSFVATNTGNVTLSEVAIADTEFGGAGELSPLVCDPAAPAVLAPGASINCTATYVVEQGDVDAGSIDNLATVTATPPGDGTPPISDEDDETVTTEAADAAISLVKTATPPTGLAVGDTVEYTLVATNTGNVTLTDVVIEDTDFAGFGELSALTCDPAAPTTLAPGAAITCAATYDVLQEDVDAGEIYNLATATGNDPSDTEVSDEADVSVIPVEANPAIELVKTADITTDLAVGDTVTYSFVATNTGNVTVSDVSIAETDFSGAGTMTALVCDPAAPVVLAPGEAIDCEATYVVEQGDVDAGVVTNIATVTGAAPDGSPVTDTDDETVTTESASPAIALVKTADPVGGVVAGTTVTYSFVATNTGNVTLSDVSIADTDFAGVGELSPLVCDPAAPTVLAPDAELTCSATYVVEQGDVDAGEIFNLATATGTPPNGGDPVTDEDDVSVSPVDPDPAIELVKTADVTENLAVGDTVTYSLVATNTGNVTLTNVTIAETDFTGAGDLTIASCTDTIPATLAPNASLECTATYVVEQEDVDAGSIGNIAIATGTPPGDGTPPVEDEDEETVTTEPADPSIALVKTADITTDLAVGDTVTYSFAATNTGNVTLTEVSIADTEFDGVGELSPLTCDPAAPAVLAPGDTIDCSATYVVEQGDVDAGSIDNLATATGQPPTGDPVTGDDDETVTTVQADPSIALTKSVDTPTGAEVGTLLTYTLVATNTGNVTLTEVSIADTDFTGAGALSALTCDPAAPATLAPNGVITCSATYVVEQGDVDAGEIYNLATATGTPPTGTPVTDEADVSVIPALAAPAIEVVKTADVTTDASVGDTITYSIVATNRGNVTLSDVVIDDTEFTGAGTLLPMTCTPEVPAVLAPNASINCTVSYVVLQEDVDAGQFGNTATVTGTPPGDNVPPVTDEDDETVVTEPAAADIVLEKTADRLVGLVVGETVTYSLTATNTGNVTLTDVVITEDEFTGVGELSELACDIAAPVSLLPGASLTCTATYVVEQGDIDAGEIYNLASTTGNPPNGAEPVEDSDDLPILPRQQEPTIHLDKSADLTTGLVVGDTVTYTFVSTNVGNVTLRNVTIEDTVFSGAGELSPLECQPAVPAVLAPSAAITCTATYVVEQEDVDAGFITNTAVTTGTTPAGENITAGDEERVDTVEAAPAIDVVKTADVATDVAVGDTVTYTIAATNVGNVTLTGVEIADTAFSGVGELSPLECDPATPLTLAPGASVNCTATYVVQQGDVDAGSLSNLATATGTPPTGPPVTGEDEEIVTPTPGVPSIEVVKTADVTEGLVVGDTVTYTLTATNTGNVTLTDVDVADTGFSGAGDLGALECDPSVPVDLAPGEAVDCTVSYEVQQADFDAGAITNVGTATGTPPSGPPVTDEDEEIVVTDPGVPSIELVKSADIEAGVVAGDTVTYTLVATNTGTLTLNDVVIEETEFSGAGDLTELSCAPASPASLAPGDSMECSTTYVVEQQDIVNGDITNVALATGTVPATGEPVSDDDDAVVVPTPAVSAIELQKVADRTEGVSVGETVTYTFIATNTGNVSLSEVQIIEGRFSGTGELTPLACSPLAPALLAPGATLECIATYVVTQADVDSGALENAATVTAVPPRGGDPVTSTDTEIVKVTDPAPALELVKSASTAGPVKVGENITYTLTATNTGNVTIDDVVITETEFSGSGELGALDCSPNNGGSLAPGKTLVCTVVYTATAQDATATRVSNTAEVSGTTPGGDTVTDEDTVVVPIAPAPVMAVTGGAVPTVVLGVGAGLTLFGLVLLAVRRRRTESASA